MMKKRFLVFFLAFCCGCFAIIPAAAQCSICTRTAQQLGEQPAKGMNGGILYLAFVPLAIVGVIAFRWWRINRMSEGT